MKCPEATRLLDGHVDGQLDAAGVLGLEDHLRECSRCRAREQGLRELRAALRRHTEYRVAPEALRARLAQQCGAEAAAPRRMSRRHFATAAAAAVAVVALGAGLWRVGVGPDSVPRVAEAEKVVYHISSSERAGAALRTLGNHLSASPATKVIVVAHNEGVDFLLRGARDETGALFEDTVRGFRDRGVEFRVCNNTLVRRKIGGDGIIPEATLVPSGIAEISRLQKSEGYAYMRM